jgi:hypothetical protein
MKPLALAFAVAVVSACAATPEERQDGGAPSGPPDHLVNRVWLSTDPSAARGTIRIFLPDGALVMDSCFETYRIAQWTRLDDRRIEWTEDTARIEAEIVELSESALRLRLHLGGDVQELAYRLADVPAVCPDMPR